MGMTGSENQKSFFFLFFLMPVVRVVKGIFVNRELPFLFLVKREMAFFSLVKRDFLNRGEP